MKSELSRSVNINKYCVIANLSTHQKSGGSIISLLTLIKENGYNRNLLIEKIGLKGEYAEDSLSGIMKYLQKLNLVSYDNQLTDVAKTSIERGYFLENEYGQYDIEVISDECIEIDKIPISFRRTNSEGKEGKVINCKTGIYKDVKSDIVFKVNEIVSSKETTISYKTRIFLMFDDQKVNSVLSISDFEHPIYNAKSSEVKKYLISAIQNKFPNLKWDTKMEGFQLLSWENFQHDQTMIANNIISTEIEHISIPYLGDFRNAKIEDIPVYPSLVTLDNWFKKDIEYSIESKFYNQSELNSFIAKKKENQAYRYFSDELKKIKVSDLIHYFWESKNYDSYWNVQAPLDLKLNFKSKGIFIKHLSESNTSISGLVTEIVGDLHPRKLIFYSKYLDKKSQQLKYKLFAQAFKKIGVDDFVLVLNDNTSLQIELLDNTVVKFNNKWTHDRYFGFLANDTWNFYKMTGEIDQVRYDQNLSTIDEETIGYWEDLTIISIDNQTIPRNLLNYIEVSEDE